MISIHAPREGSDAYTAPEARGAVCISIHAPREGSDARRSAPRDAPGGFLSTLPVRGATPRRLVAAAAREFLSTLPVRGATSPYSLTAVLNPFLSTLPVRGATNGDISPVADLRNFYPRSP